MKKRCGLVSTLVLSCNLLQGKTTYFPPTSLHEDAYLHKLTSKYYSDYLGAMNEPSLWESRKKTVEEYRFLWLPTWDQPIAVRISISSDGTGQVTAKVLRGSGGGKPGKLVTNHVRQVSSDVVDSFRAQLESTNFWKLPTYEYSGGRDGARWIFEGVKHGKYHAVDRWSPQINRRSPTDGNYERLGKMFLLELGQLKLAEKDIY